MNIKRLVILLSLLLAIAPVTVAYSALLVDDAPQQSSHCMQTDQQHEQNNDSCCQDDQCGSHCLVMQCSQFSKLSVIPVSVVSATKKIVSSISAPGILDVPAGGWSKTPLRPPINIL